MKDRCWIRIEKIYRFVLTIKILDAKQNFLFPNLLKLIQVLVGSIAPEDASLLQPNLYPIAKNRISHWSRAISPELMTDNP